MDFRKTYQKIYYQYLKRHYFGITAKSRVLPDFLLIGAVRSGTTSLYYDICQHPSVHEAAYDEIGFFDDNFHLGEEWYRSLFPSKKKMFEIPCKPHDPETDLPAKVQIEILIRELTAWILDPEAFADHKND